ncbi:restriction endonuclease subunit S [Lactococcus lactis]|uniref:restriction endonuclease subunit S n=1 Tax=Lactococcus lactis TaxID=1358 RepID=UPI00211D30B2|nr:restriction endonuclease subunit S [Lactococcus lactis]MDG4970615.1 restriction endonuclease subunit S [Lactococcus lactis]
MRKLSDIVVRLSKSSINNQLPKVEFEDIIASEGRLNKDVSHKFDDRKGILFEPNNILYGKLRPYLKNWLFADFKGIALGDFWVFKPINSEPKFIYCLIQSDNYQRVANDTSGTKMPRSDWKKVSSSYFSIPRSIEEQEKIGNLFKQLDNTITLHQRKLDKLKQLKQGYLQQMFLKNDEKVPRVRFANFDDEWGQRKAKDIFKPRIEKGKPELPVLSVTQYNGVVYRDNVGINIKYDKNTLINYKVIHKNDFVISLRSFQGGFELSDKLGISSPAYTIFIPQDSKSHDSLFWKNQFKTYKFIESLKSVTFGIRDGKSISFSEFGTLKLRFPNQKHEQKLVGLLFEKLNHTIVLHQSKIEKLKLLKQVLLQKMFI